MASGEGMIRKMDKIAMFWLLIGIHGYLEGINGYIKGKRFLKDSNSLQK